MKTVREIARELGTDKQKIYRYIVRNQIAEMPPAPGQEASKNRTKYYDDETVERIRAAFAGTPGQGVPGPEPPAAPAPVQETPAPQSAEEQSVAKPVQQSAEQEPAPSVGEQALELLRRQLQAKDREIELLGALLEQERQHTAQILSQLQRMEAAIRQDLADAGREGRGESGAQDPYAPRYDFDDGYEPVSATDVDLPDEPPAPQQQAPQQASAQAAPVPQGTGDGATILHFSQSEDAPPSVIHPDPVAAQDVDPDIWRAFPDDPASRQKQRSVRTEVFFNFEDEDKS